MADIVLHTQDIPQPGSVLSVPVAVEYGLDQGGLVIGGPEDATIPIWNETGDHGPIAEGSRAHIFVAPSWHTEHSSLLGDVVFEGNWKLDILDTISAIKSNGLPLSNFAAKLGNAYCYDYSNPYTRGCAVGLTDASGAALANRFKFTRINFAGRIDAAGFNQNHTGTFYYKLTETLMSSGTWSGDGVNKDNMYDGVHKDVGTGNVYEYGINNTKSALDPLDADDHTVECYRGLFFADDPVNTGETAAGDILVIVDWDDEMEYTVFDGFDQDGFPLTTTTLGPKAFFSIAWSIPGTTNNERLLVTTDPEYEYSRMIDVYPAAPAVEFNFITLGGGGGGGHKGRGGRAVSSAIPMRITSRGDIDYRHYLDLYDETNYPERNMFLTNFVGRIPYRYIDYDSSEGGGTGIVRVETDLQFTHFVGASFTDDNVPRVYEVISHKNLGGNPKTLLCTFKVCHLKDYFQHFGVTSENEFLVERSTNAGLYNPWLKDPRMFCEEYVESRYNFGSGGFSGGWKILITLTNNQAIMLTAGLPSDQWTAVHVQYHSTYTVSTFNALLNLAEYVDNEPRMNLATVSFISAVLSKIRAVYLIPAEFAAAGSPGSVSVDVDASVFEDPTDPDSNLNRMTYTLVMDGTIVTLPEEGAVHRTVYAPQDGPIFNDWTDIDASYFLSVPWYGEVELSGTELKRMLDGNGGSISIEYHISILDGTITILADTAVDGTLKAWKRLPKISLPASARTLTYRQTNLEIQREATVRDDSTSWQSLMSIGGGLVAGAAALMLGNPIAAVGAVGGGIASAVGVNVSNDLRDRSAAIGSEIARSNIMFNATSCSGYEMLHIYSMKVIKVKKLEILNVYSSIGYPCRALWRSVGAVNGKKYWVSILGTIRGTGAYAQAVRGEIERDGIIYNYS